MSLDWRVELAKELPEDQVMVDLHSRQKFSKDYFYFSPILTKELEREIADCVVRPSTQKELDIVLAFAAANRVSITVRGAGTGNYGQAVPIGGGLVLDISRMNRIVKLEGDTMVAEAGARMGKMEQFARQHEMELLCYPSTYQTATIGGFINGGSGGIGSIANGTIWDGMVRAMTLKTVEDVSRTFRVEGGDAVPYIHSYGTIGVLAEVEVRLAPMRNWAQWGVSFDSFERAMEFGIDVAEDERLTKRLISVHEWPIPKYFKPIRLAPEKSVVMMEIVEEQSGLLKEKIVQWGGEVSMTLGANQYHRTTGVSDFSFNHTTLWIRREDSTFTYLQAGFDRKDWQEQAANIRASFPEVYMHVELMRNNGKLSIAGLPVFQFATEERLNLLIDFCRSIGVSIANPHTWRLELGGRSAEHSLLAELKRKNDPLGLLNPHKLELNLQPEQAV